MSRTKKYVRLMLAQPASGKCHIGLKLFKLLKQNVSFLVNDMAARINMPQDDIDEVISDCKDKGLIFVAGSEGSRTVEFNDDKKKILGVGFNNNEAFLTVMDISGNILDREVIKAGALSTSKAKLKNKEINEVAAKIKSDTNLRDKKFYAAGVAIPGGVEEKNEKGRDLLSEGISHAFNCDVVVLSEEAACGYGERDYIEQTKDKDVLYIHSDVGVGIVVKNEIIFEADKIDLENNSSYLRPWRQFSMVFTAKNLLNKGVGTDIVNMVDGNIDNVTMKIVLDAAGKKDELADDLVKRAGLALGVRSAYLVNTFNTPQVIFGGGTEKEEGNFMGFVKESMVRFLLKDLVDELEMVSGTLGKEASSIGAALLCRRQLFMEV